MAKVIGSVTFDLGEKPHPCEVCGVPLISAILTIESGTHRVFWETHSNGEHTREKCIRKKDRRDEEPDRAPSAEQEQAWDEQYDGTSFGA